eukprot:CAMPEP_0184350892 /NCGR_PEP_ID=MMETSP1089-20130417/43005_1 /TAXON_ID=38269 ORGANISM="Gloeochaete wittrockiana, Strain SAG46.84" /NCGR_SAMPLE_ID=MMETSP1089 /ASSEMBLY_ACC=CAM_ASM_000445 /LENGTH=93 /DNA_ID=CAMNT_0026684005 /DNA_START=32 /DNA_END=310 /DNA_ORIENTATION=+
MRVAAFFVILSLAVYLVAAQTGFRCRVADDCPLEFCKKSFCNVANSTCIYRAAAGCDEYSSKTSDGFPGAEDVNSAASLTVSLVVSLIAAVAQ